MLSIFKKKKQELVLVFDIRSSSVGAALFWIEDSQIPRVVASVREAIPLEQALAPDRLLTLSLSALEKVVSKIAEKKVGTPIRIFCVLAAPWHVSETRVIKLTKETPFIFTSKLADELTQKEIASMKEEYTKRYQDLGAALRPIELKNVKVKLNGYETEKPIGKNASEVEMDIHISMSGDEICKKIEEVIEKHFPVKEVKFSSFTMAAFSALRDVYHDRENFLIINIAGELTDIAMVKHGTLRETASFPLGTHFMVRGVASALNVSTTEAYSFFSLHKDGNAAEPTLQTLDPIVNKLKLDWLHKFQEALVNLSNDISIPGALYLITNKDLTQFFTELIKSEQFNQYTLTESKFEITPCGIEVFHNAVAFKENAPFDAYLAIDSIYINRFFS